MDIIIRSRVHIHYFDFLSNCIQQPEFLISARCVDELILTTIKLNDKKWCALTQQAIIGRMADSLEELANYELYSDYVDNLTIALNNQIDDEQNIVTVKNDIRRKSV